MNIINRFDGKYAFLSNFSLSPITFEGITYPTVEHYFQAMKTLDLDMRRTIAAAATPGIAKRMGRKVHLREDWERVKDAYMKNALRAKFQDPKLKAKLLATGDTYLEEGNTWHEHEDNESWLLSHHYCSLEQSILHLSALLTVR